MTTEFTGGARTPTLEERQSELSLLKARIAELERALERAETALAHSAAERDVELREIESKLAASACDNKDLRRRLSEMRAQVERLERQTASSRWLLRTLLKKLRELPRDVARRRENSRAKRRQLQTRREELLRLRIFDAKWYASHHPAAADKGADPILHFITQGRAQGFSPTPAFDEQLYLAANPNLTPFLKYGFFASGADHFLKNGMTEIASGYPWRRLPFRVGNSLYDFDEAAYLADNSDVRELVRRGSCDSGLQHFLSQGFAQMQAAERKIYSDARFVNVRGVLDFSNHGRRARHACIFAHYDRQNLIDDCVLKYLNALHALEIEIVFVTVCDNRAELSKISGLASRVVIKTDAGRDFGSWYAALKADREYFDRFDYLLLVNDSVYCPIMPLEAMFNAMQARRLNMWGVTESIQLEQYHLQSYFLAFDRIARAKVLEPFLSMYPSRPYLTKFGQIIEYELGFTKSAMEQGLRIGAWCSNSEIKNLVATDPRLRSWRGLIGQGFERINPSHHLWSLLITRFNCPTLKVELLRDNPYGATGVSEWPLIVADRGVGAESIRRHLERTRCVRAAAALSPAVAHGPETRKS